MPVFNAPEFLGPAIESMLAQTACDWELLIIDDGSTEPVQDVIAAYRDARIRVVQQEHRGLSATLNRGLTMAGAPLVARMDGDDLSGPRRLAAQVEAFDQHPGLDLVGSFFQVIDHTGRVMERRELLMDPLYRLWRLQFHNCYAHGSIMYRRTAVHAAGRYDERFTGAQDYDLWSRMSTPANTRMIPQFLYSHRLRGDGSQTSVRRYQAQLEHAVTVSNRNLKACNPHLDDTWCEEVRALYWNFRRPRLSEQGIAPLMATLEGFCTRFRVSRVDRDRLSEQVRLDVANHLDGHGRHEQGTPWSETH
jgi:glycosyltransferase involved in cell wall biosynthesis